MVPINAPSSVTLKFKCHACDQECDIEAAPGQAINHRALLGSRFFAAAEQLAAIKVAKGAPVDKMKVPQFLRLTKELEELESEIIIWDPISAQAHAILVMRGKQRAGIASTTPDHKDPG